MTRASWPPGSPGATELKGCPSETHVHAERRRHSDRGRELPSPWQVGDLPEPPRPGWKLWVGLIGPGIVLAGTSIGSGEWLFGPAVTAQYGAALLWLALLSILFQGFCNLTMMRYTVYSGEPIIVGGLRTWPGPGVWVACYAVLDLASIWPYNASNAAVPLAAVVLGRLPQTIGRPGARQGFRLRDFLAGVCSARSSAEPSIACSSGS